MSVSMELGKVLDKAYEGKSLDEVLQAPPSALAGLTEKHDAILKDLGIKTIKDMATYKYFALANALARAGEYQG